MSKYWDRTRQARLTLFAVLVVLLVLYRIVGALEVTSVRWFAAPPPTSLGLEVSPPDASMQTGWQRVTEVDMAGAAQMAGIRQGDAIRFSVPWKILQYQQPGEEVPVLIERSGARFATTITAEQRLLQAGESIFPILFWLLIALALLLLTRGRGNRAATMLAMILLSIPIGTQLTWFPDWVFAPITSFGLGMRAAAPLFFVIFALALTERVSSQRMDRMATATGIAMAGLFGLVTISTIFAIPLQFNVRTLYGVIIALTPMISLAIIGANYSHIDQSARNRIKIVLAAFGALMLGGSASQIAPYFGVSNGLAFQPFGFLAVGLFTYAVLAQRLFDFGFAINRTLVYGAAAFTLLATFGLVEYVAKSMIPVAWPTAGPFISAGIAVLLFLTFHRLHHWFEHHIERLFFGDWQRAEAALKRFVESAGHFDKMPVLCGAFTDALSRYSGGANVALYLRDGDGTYSQQSGTLAGVQAIYDDDPAFALMRTERRPVFLNKAEGSLPGTLALPMLDQGTLHGFALLGAKPDNANYRPDEVENLGKAAHQVGLDFQALQARELRALVTKLNDRNASLSVQNERISQERDRLAGVLDRVAPQA